MQRLSSLLAMRPRFVARECRHGDIPSAMMVLRLAQHRAQILGWGTKDHVAKLTITDAPAGGEPPKALSIEFVLPGGGHVAMDSIDTQYRTPRTSIDSPVSPPSSPPLRIKPEPTDLVLDKVQPSAWKKPRGGFDWS
jgi:hypothetical protein